MSFASYLVWCRLIKIYQRSFQGIPDLYDADFRRHPFGAFYLGVRRTPLRGGFFDGVLRHHGGAASAFFSAADPRELPQDCADSAVGLKEQALNEAAGFG